MIEKIKNYFNEFKNGTKIMFKEFFKKETNKKQRANMWTFSRLICSFLVVFCSLIAALSTNLILLAIAASITCFGAMTDYFDGKSARKYGSSSEYGKLLDQVTDKIFSLMIGISLSLFNPLYLLIILGEGIITGININYSSKYKDLKINSTQIGRIKQWPLCASLALGFLSPINSTLLNISNSFILTTLMLQLLTAKSYIKQNSNEIRKKEINDTISLLNSYEENNKVKKNSLELTKNNNSIEINKSQTLSRKEQYQVLKNVLNEIIIKKEKNNELSNQKQLKK